MTWYSDIPVPGSVPDPTAAPVSSLVSTRTAGANVSGHRVLMFSTGGVVVHADPTSAGYVFAGVSTQAASSGALVSVTEAGDVTEPTWTWTPGAALFAGAGGVLTTTPPTTGILQQIGTAITATTIDVAPYPPIVRS